MKKNKIYLTVLTILLTAFSYHTFAQLPDTWAQKGDFGSTARYGAVTFSIGDKGYLGTGWASLRVKDFWEYDPATDSWSQKADFGGTARVFASGFSIGIKGYLGCGDDGTPTKDFWEYNPATNNWTQKGDFGGLNRGGAVSFSIGSKGYLGTGLTNSITRLNDFWEYEPSTDTWTQKSNVGGPARAYATGFNLGSKGYIGTGNSGFLEKDFWEYTPSTDTWAQKTNFGGLGRFGAVSVSIGSLGYIGLGDVGGGYSNDFWGYNPVSDTWTQEANFGGSKRTASSGLGIGNKVFVGLGDDGILGFKYKDFWEYTPFCTPPSIISQPVNQVVTYGTSATFTVVASNAASFQWQENAGSGFVNITDGGIYSNTGTSSLGISLPGVSMNGYKYRCVVSSTCLPATTSDGNATLSVTAKPIVITPNAGQTKVYGSSDPLPFTYTYAPSLEGADAITGLMGRAPGENAGPYAFTLGTLSAGNNYQLSLASGPNFIISTLSVVLTPNAGQTKVFGSADPTPFSYTIAPSLVGTDAITGLMGRNPGENIGTYAFTAGSLNAGPNYTLSVALSPVFTVTQLPVIITATAGQTKVYGSPDPTPFTYTYSPSLVGTDAITGLLGRTPGENVGFYGYTLGSLSAGGNYSLSVSGVQSFSITKRAVAVTANPGQTKVYGTGDPVLTYSYSPTLVSGDAFSGTLSRLAGENAGLYAITQGTLSAGSNYTLNFVPDNFSILTKPILVTANAGQSKTYGSADPSVFAYAYSPALIGTDAITGLLSRVAGENAGNYAYALGTLTAGPNYNLSVAATPAFTIVQKNLTITAENKSKCYDGAIFSSGYTVVYSGFVNGEDHAVLGSTLVFGGTAITAVDPGTYTIIPSGFTSANYAITYVSGTLQINVSTAPSISGLNSLCAGSSAVQYTTEPGFSNYVWTISYGGMITAGLNTNQVSVNWETAGSRSISVNYNNTGGCFSSSPATLNLTVLSVPVPLIFGDDSICSGSNGVVYSTQINQSGYQWSVSPGGVIASGAGTNSIMVNWTGSGNQTVSVAYTNELGCQSLSPTVFNIDVLPLPLTAGPVNGPLSICKGSSGVVYSVVPVASATSYHWTVPSGANIVAGEGTSSITVDFSAYAASGFINVFGLNGCGAGAASPDLNVQLNAVPSSPVITQHGDTLKSSANSGNQWYLDGIEITGATGPEYIAYTIGNYNVIVTLNGCSSPVSNSILLVAITANEIGRTAQCAIYPNPSNGVFNIKMETSHEESYTLEIFNNLGVLVLKQEEVHIDGTYTSMVDLQGSPAGVYTVVLRNKANSIVKKVVIMK